MWRKQIPGPTYESVLLDFSPFSICDAISNPILEEEKNSLCIHGINYATQSTNRCLHQRSNGKHTPHCVIWGWALNLYNVTIVPQSGVNFHPHENGELTCFPFLFYCSFLIRFYDIVNKVFTHVYCDQNPHYC